MPDFRTVATGAIAGLSATAPMTLAMQLMKEQLPRSEQFPLPPRLITEVMAERTGADKVLDTETSRKAATFLNHFGYGAAVGALFGLTRSKGDLRDSVASATLQGMGWGLAVWAGSYLGWLPSAGILPPATRQSKERNALMVAAHLVWGASLGAFSAGLMKSAEDAGRL
jgi:hypothetical protein